MWICFLFVFVLDIALSRIIVYIFFMSKTYQPNKRKRAKTHGFLTRNKTHAGTKVIQARRRKGRARLAVKTK